jgi:hypothetical protein
MVEIDRKLLIAWVSDIQIIRANLEIAAQKDWKFSGALKAAKELERDLRAILEK